jgi:hypothetical protein
MPSSTSNLFVNEQQTAAKRKQDDLAAAGRGSGRRRYHAPRVGGSHHRHGYHTQDPR